MNRGVLSGLKSIFIPEWAGGGDPANDGALLGFDSTQPGGVKPVPAGTSAYTRIAQTVLGAAAATIDFTSIPATYENLIIEIMGRGDTAAGNINPLMTFNGDTGANYDWEELYGLAATAPGTVTGTAVAFMQAGTLTAASCTAGAVGASRIVIPNYARTVFRKVFHASGFTETASDAAPSMQKTEFGGQWRSTAAITRVTLTASAGNFIAGTVATLYGEN